MNKVPDLGLLAAWLLRGLKPRLCMALWLFFGVVVGFVVGGAVAYAARTSQLAAFGGEQAEPVPMDAYVDIVREVECQCAEVVRDSEWFGALDYKDRNGSVDDAGLKARHVGPGAGVGTENLWRVE